MKKEDFFISGFTSSKIGDDGAVVGDMVYSKDLFCEGIHFKREWMSLFEIAQKSMLVNISDAIVMNAKPKYALIGIVIPKEFSKSELKELSRGFLESAKRYNIEIIGGDTTSGKNLMISVTIISKSIKPIFRKGSKKGDLVAYTSSLGSVGRDLRKLLRGVKLSSKSKFITPSLKDIFFYEASKYIHASLDISDGLSKDLSRLCRVNNLGVKFFKKIPKEVLCSGEEYEILFSFDKRNLAKINFIAKKYRVEITPFAKMIRGSYKTSCKENHF